MQQLLTLADPGIQKRGGANLCLHFSTTFFRIFSVFPPKNSIYLPKFLMTFFLVIDLFRVLYMVFFHRGAKSAADIDTEGPKSLLFNKITILPLLFLAKLHCQF